MDYYFVQEEAQTNHEQITFILWLCGIFFFALGTGIVVWVLQ